MSPDELARELEDLQRFAPPAGDPIALLEHDTRIADLEQENEELKQAVAARASQLATLSLDLDHLKDELAQVQSTRDTLQRQVELHDTELRLRQQSWSRAALKERSEKRAQYAAIRLLDFGRRCRSRPRFHRRLDRPKVLVLHPR